MGMSTGTDINEEDAEAESRKALYSPAPAENKKIKPSTITPESNDIEMKWLLKNVEKYKLKN